MDEAENQVLSYMSFPKTHWQKIHSTNPIERLNSPLKTSGDEGRRANL